MSLIAYLIVLAVFGLVVGALARLLVPGPDPMGVGLTILVGLCGHSAPGCSAGTSSTATAAG